MLVFVSGWMFFLGILVGRGTVPLKFDINKLQKELAALKKADTKEQLKKVEVGSDSNEMQRDLGFYEALKDTKDKGTTFKSTKSGASSENQPSHPKAVSKVNKKIDSSNNQRTDASRKSKTPSLGKDTNSEKNLTIQAASFRDPKDAEQMVNKLRDKGYPAYKIIGVVPEKGVWYRVRIGYYGSRTEAAAMMKKLQKGGYKPYLVNR